MKNLRTPGSAFTLRKQKILSQLALPDEQYTDASPKGSVDARIRALIDQINSTYAGLVTTSSCAGRVSVYLEGRKAALSTAGERFVEDDGGRSMEAAAASGSGSGNGSAASASASFAGGKGGGEWLFVSHDPIQPSEYRDGVAGEGYEKLLLGENGGLPTSGNGLDGAARLIHFKFEPMILHILTASPEHAQLVVQAGMEAGFRETGAVSLLSRQPDEEATPMVAVRSMGLSFESLIGAEVNGVRQLTVSPEYLQTLVRISNERFVENDKRIARFSAALEAAFTPPKGKDDWEDAQIRRERKRLEGLRRREELKKETTVKTEAPSVADLQLNIA